MNAPNLSGAWTETALQGAYSFLSDNSVGRLVMAGSASLSVTGDCDVTIDVTRLASKIVVDKITNGFAGSWLSGKTLTLNSLYVTNVCGSLRYDGTFAGTVWHNRMGYDAAESAYVKALTFDSVNASIAQGSSRSTSHTFYCYANPSTDTDTRGGTWSVRSTRLVLDVGIEDVTEHCYYVVDLPDISGNTIYRFSEITLVNIGAEDEESLADATALKFTVSVTGWESESADLEMGLGSIVEPWDGEDSGEDV